MRSLRIAAFLFCQLAVASAASAFNIPPFATDHEVFQSDQGDKDTDPGDDRPDTCGSPVEVATGNLVYPMELLYSASLGPPIDLTLTYNSKSRHRSQFGIGWSHAFGMRLIHATDGVQVVAICGQATGRRDRFLQNPDGSFSSPPFVHATLVRQPSGEFILSYKNQTSYTFDQTGYLVAVSDRHGNSITLTYDSAGFLIAVTDASGRSLRLTKNGNGLVDTITDFMNNDFRFSYDSDGHLNGVTNRTGGTVLFDYTANRLSKVRDPKGNQQLGASYDSTGRVISLTEGAETYTYQYATNVTTKRDSGGASWVYTYNGAGSITGRRDPLGRLTSTIYDSNLNVTQQTDANGNVTRYQYDANGNILVVTDALGNSRQFTYNSFGFPTAVMDALGNQSTFDYDSRGNLVATRTPTGAVTHFSYNAKGQLVAVMLASGDSTTFTYDQYGNVSELRDASGRSRIAEYDLNGRPVRRATTGSGDTRISYDTDGRLVRVVDALGGVTEISRDLAGNMTSVVAPNAARFALAYDAFNRLTQISNSLNQATSFAYDKHNNLIRRTTPRQHIITYQFDGADRLITKTTPDDSVSYAYDNNGNVIRASDSDSVVSFGYNRLNMVVQASTGSTIAQPATSVVYTYDANGNRKTINYPGGGVTYEYDSNSKVVSIGESNGFLASIARDELSRRTQMTRAGAKTSYLYDPDGALAGLSHQSPAGNLAFLSSYDAAGRLEAISGPSGVRRYSYDPMSQLTGSTVTSGGASEAYAYHLGGNRMSSLQSSSYVYDQANRLIADQTFDYSYDANGNMVMRRRRGNGEATVYTYDSENRLTQIRFADGGTAEYRYDALGRRIQKTVRGVSASFVFDGLNPVAEFTGSSPTATFVNGLQLDELLAVRRSGFLYLPQTDPTDSVIRVDSGNSVVAGYALDSFGQLLGDQSQGVLPNRFQGREYDAESGLYYFRARYYDPTVGRFISEDPASLLAGVNLYEFVGNNPLNNRDPLGLAKNAEFCNRLLEKIQNVQDRIDKRLRDLDEDPLGLPGSCPGDDVKPSLSREGHQRLINEDKALLDALKAEYLAKCSDEPPNGSPAADESWFDRKYWERVTGLSGAALIAFMIIEVWSRLFPPRNLIPI